MRSVEDRLQDCITELQLENKLLKEELAEARDVIKDVLTLTDKLDGQIELLSVDELYGRALDEIATSISECSEEIWKTGKQYLLSVGITEGEGVSG